MAINHIKLPITYQAFTTLVSLHIRASRKKVIPWEKLGTSETVEHFSANLQCLHRTIQATYHAAFVVNMVCVCRDTEEYV